MTNPNKPDDFSPAAVLQAITELRRWEAELNREAGTTADFALRWAERNGGYPKTEAARAKMEAELFATFPAMKAATEKATRAMVEVLKEQYPAWAKKRGVKTMTRKNLDRFKEETGLLNLLVEQGADPAGTNDLARQIAQRRIELSRAAEALGFDPKTISALKGVAGLMQDTADGRAALTEPGSWPEARQQAIELFQREAIDGIPLHLAAQVALDKLEHAAKLKLDRATPAAAPTGGLLTLRRVGAISVCAGLIALFLVPLALKANPWAFWNQSLPSQVLGGIISTIIGLAVGPLFLTPKKQK